MALESAQLISISLILCFAQFDPWIVYGVSGDPRHILLSRNDQEGARPTMIMPLYLSASNSSVSAFDSRRQLQRSEAQRHPNARMRLHDDLLLNGYYTTRLWIGTPPQMFALIVDTGSTDPKFQPELSSTYEPVKCTLDCNCDNDRNQCMYERQYAEMSTSSGVLGNDVVSFGNQSELEPQRAVFGCENLETGDLYSQHADGIMGLGRGDLSIVDQLVDKNVISDSFSLCYGGMDFGGGAMVLGGISPPLDMVFAHSDPVRSPYYNIDLKEIHVAGKQLSLNPKVFDGKHGTVLDSGTTYAYLPEEAFLAFKDAIMKELHSFKQIPGPDPNYNDICFSGAGIVVSELSKSFPTVDMVFGNGQKFSLSPENYLFRHSKVRGAYCLGVFQNGKDPTTLLGGIIVRNTLVMYDRENSKVGFWKTNCSELWERLHLSASPPSQSPKSDEANSTGANSTGAFTPAVAPSALLHNDLHPGELQISQITIEISFNISYLDMKAHITELAGLIAHELNVDTSQVHLLNFTSLGNGSFSSWAITPDSSADYISNTTAMSIISRLAEHRLQLPSTFGNYKLVGWNVESQSKRTWWQQHYLVVALVVLVTLLLALSTIGIFLILKNRQQQVVHTYKPVSESVPEQELQPLCEESLLPAKGQFFMGYTEIANGDLSSIILHSILLLGLPLTVKGALPSTNKFVASKQQNIKLKAEGCSAVLAQELVLLLYAGPGEKASSLGDGAPVGGAGGPSNDGEGAGALCFFPFFFDFFDLLGAGAGTSAVGAGGALAGAVVGAGAGGDLAGGELTGTGAGGELTGTGAGGELTGVTAGGDAAGGFVTGAGAAAAFDGDAAGDEAGDADLGDEAGVSAALGDEAGGADLGEATGAAGDLGLEGACAGDAAGVVAAGVAGDLDGAAAGD
ncbi:aspartic proteinase-like protein 2 [Senna tora]|uniref:Aspartic proteinase-like protein 2 n=1 Tax=Senna tora TaxID=362788 RepID=A0A834TYV6_9FABA|nr:aspartic proteinase-like protein 2 [Senna tora]